MDCVIDQIVKPIGKCLMDRVKQELDFLVSSSTKFGDVRTKENELDGAEEDVKTLQQINNGNSQTVPHRVPGWLEDVAKIKAEIAEIAKKIPAGDVGLCNIMTRYKVGKDSSDISKRIDILLTEKKKMEWTKGRIPIARVPSTSTSVHNDDEKSQNKNTIESRDLIFNDVLKSLEPSNNNTQKMALCGMGGVGKSTMMRQLKDAAKKRKMFDLIVDVEVGKDPVLTSVQKAVAEHLGDEPLTETFLDTKAKRLQQKFEKLSDKGKNNILVILDNVWEKFDLENIGLTSSLPNGFKLLITTREERVCTDMCVETSFIFKLQELKDPEDKKLFWKSVGRLVSIDDIEPDMRDIGEKIVKICGGLPLALDIIGSTLKGKNEMAEWRNTLSCLENKKFPVIASIGSALTNIFMLSYENLKEDEFKAIFLLCGLLSQDYNILIEDLVMYGWGLRFFKDVYTIRAARDSVITCVNTLIRSNLLIESDREGYVKIHDLVRDFVLSNFSEVKQASIVNHDRSVSEQLQKEKSYDRILLNCEGMPEFPEDFDHANLSFLKLMDGNKLINFPEDFSTRMRKLEVVAFEEMRQLVLPQFSTNLRVLFLRSCSFVNADISFIGDLLNLEVLDLADCGIRKVPTEIGKLKRLKLLDLRGCANDLCIDDGVLQNLKKLEELYMRPFQNRAIQFTEANCKELQVLLRKLSALELEFIKNKDQPKYISFEKLERFRISVGCQLDRKIHIEEENEYSLRNTLMLECSCTELLECKINELFRKTEIIYLQLNDMNRLEDISTHHPEQSFCNLKILCVSNCEKLTYLFTIPVVEGLRKLESLEISSCPVLKSVVNGHNSEVGLITFHKLKILYLHDLPELVSMCDSVNVMEQLPELMGLKLYKLPYFTSIFPQNNINISANQPFLKKKAVAPKLEILSISDMENLKEIWPCEITGNEDEVYNIFMLRKIEVTKCQSLVNLFPSNPMRFLSRLEDLEVEECGFIEVLFNIELDKIEQFSSINSSLRNIGVRRCESFREVWRIKDTENNYSRLLIRGFQAVEKIYIYDCDRFTKIVTPTTANFDMRSLKEIDISGSGEYGERKNELVKNGQEQEGLEVVFEIQSPSINKYQSLVTTQQQPLPLLPYLEKLELMNMETLSHVWKCNNWNEFFILHKQSSSFQNLTSINLSYCKSIKYLFSPLMVKLLSRLKDVKISDCDSMEEVVSSRDDKDEEMRTCVYTPTSLFPHLHLLQLYSMKSLKHIGGGIANGTTHGESKVFQMDFVHWSLCQYPTEIDLNECDDLLSVIPSYADGRMQKLQELSISGCRSMKEVFETEEINNNMSMSGCGSSSSTTVTIPRPTTRTMHELPNLKILQIYKCDLLEYVFTFSTLESLKALETLEVSACKAMKVIVKEEAGDNRATTSKDVVFPNLKSIELDDLPDLAGFFLGMNIKFQWPLLDYVMIDDCPQMTVFTSGLSMAPRLKYIHTKLGKHNLECGINFDMKPTIHQTSSPCTLDGVSLGPTTLDGKPWLFHNLIECNLKWYSGQKIFPWNELQQLQNLETVHANICDVEEVFEVGLEAANNESQTVVKFPKLREVELEEMYSLKYIWKSNQWRKLEFPNLTRLSISRCESLEHVFTCSMVGCVMQLQGLSIEHCKTMKVIVKEEEDCEHAKVIISEIKFPCLKSLILDDLSSLEGFYLGKEDVTLPSLDTLVITECPMITVFSQGRSITPELRVIKIRSDSFNVNAEEDIINSFIKTKKQEIMEGYFY